MDVQASAAVIVVAASRSYLSLEDCALSFFLDHLAPTIAPTKLLEHKGIMWHLLERTGEAKYVQ